MKTKKKLGKQLSLFDKTKKKLGKQLSLFDKTKKKTVAKKKPLKVLPKKLKGKVTLAQLNKARKEGGIALSSSNRQTGGSSRTKDILKKAKSPGKRLSANGTIYYESRKNRSDKSNRI